MLALKIKIIEKIKKEIEGKIVDVKSNYENTRESRNADTKSSAGDKYETGREMIQIEMNKLQALLSQYQSQLNLMASLDSKPHELVKNGSLVKTNQGYFFIGLGLGKMQIETIEFFSISMDSPLGLQLKSKVKNDFYELAGKKYQVLDIV